MKIPEESSQIGGVLLALNMGPICLAIRSSDANASRITPVFDRMRPILSTGDMQPWYTSKPNSIFRRSHISHCVFDSTWEAAEAYHLDQSDVVAAWVKNDHLGFEILYASAGAIRKYRPDFLIRLADGTMLVLEVKGQDSAEARTKRDYLAEWCEAITSHGGLGVWKSAVSYGVDDLEGILERSVKQVC